MNSSARLVPTLLAAAALGALALWWAWPGGSAANKPDDSALSTHAGPAITAAATNGPQDAVDSADENPPADDLPKLPKTWRQRADRFDQIKKTLAPGARPARDELERARDEAIAMLQAESELVASGAALPGDYATYFANLIGAVSGFGTPKAAAVLLTPTVIGTGGVPARGVARLGGQAIPLVDEALRSRSEGPSRVALLMVFAHLLSDPTLAPTQRERIAQTVRPYASDPDPSVQQAAASILGMLGATTASR